MDDLTRPALIEDRAYWIEYADSLEKRIESLTEDLENERARGIHSCSPHCQRPLCVARREIESLTARVAELEPDAMAYRELVEAMCESVAKIDGQKTPPPNPLEMLKIIGTPPETSE